MANYFARKAGNINATDVWATTPAGTASDVWGTFTSADVLHSNGFVVTVNVSTTVGQVRNDNANSATAGGNFALANGVTLTADIYAGTIGSCVTWNQGVGTSANIVSTSINAGSAGNGIQINGNGVLNITSTSINGGGTGANSRGVDILHSSVVNITSTTINGGTSNGSTGVTLATGQANITGNVNGGNNVGAGASTAYGINNFTAGLLNLTGIASAGLIAAGAHNSSTGTLTLTRAKSNAYGPGNSVGLAAVVGASNAGLGVIEIQELEYGTYGMSPTSGTGIRLKKLASNVAVFNYCNTAGAKTLIDATQNAAMPAATDVRFGVSYASGALTGSAYIPAAGSTALGVPVDATTGTAVLTAADVQSALTAQGLTTARAGNLDNLDATVSSRLAPSGTLATVTNLTNAPASVTPSDIWSHANRTITGGTVDTLTNAPSVPSASAIADEVRVELATELARIDAPISGAGNAPSAATVATAVRSELSVELARVDQAVSTRLAGSAYTAPANSDVAAIKAKTDALNTERLANVATTAIVGNLIAQANS
jgi:hypothetical protein